MAGARATQPGLATLWLLKDLRDGCTLQRTSGSSVLTSSIGEIPAIKPFRWQGLFFWHDAMLDKKILDIS